MGILAGGIQAENPNILKRLTLRKWRSSDMRLEQKHSIQAIQKRYVAQKGPLLTS
jgi:hypothetical protein